MKVLGTGLEFFTQVMSDDPTCIDLSKYIPSLYPSLFNSKNFLFSSNNLSSSTYLASYAFYTTLSVCHYREAEGLAMSDMRAHSPQQRHSTNRYLQKFTQEVAHPHS